MATTRQSQTADSFTDGLSKYAEAARHSMTASRLAVAGTMALGAACYLYFADPERREAAMNNATRMFEGMTSWWTGLSRGAPDDFGATPPSADAGSRPAPGTAA